MIEPEGIARVSYVLSFDDWDEDVKGWHLPKALRACHGARLEIEGEFVKSRVEGKFLVPQEPQCVDGTTSATIEVDIVPLSNTLPWLVAIGATATALMFAALWSAGQSGAPGVLADNSQGAVNTSQSRASTRTSLSGIPNEPAAIEHHGDVWSVDVSPQGTVATGDDGGVLRIWSDVDDGDLLKIPPLSVECCESHIWDVKFSRDGGLLAIAGDDGTITLLETEDGRRRWQISLDEPVKQVDISADLSKIGAATGTKVVILDVKNGSRLFSLGEDAKNQVVFALDQESIYSTRMKENHVWEVLEFDMPTRKLRRTLPAGREQIYELAVSGSGKSRRQVSKEMFGCGRKTALSPPSCPRQAILHGRSASATTESSLLLGAQTASCAYGVRTGEIL